MAYDDHLEEHFQRELEAEVITRKIVRRARFRDYLDHLLKRYDSYLTEDVRWKSSIEELEEKVSKIVKG